MKRLLALVLCAVLAGCGGSADSTQYKQTWTKPYAQTNCADWSNVMAEHQRYVMASDFLLTLRRQVQSEAGIPSDADIGRFEGAMTEQCDAPMAGITAENRDMASISFVAYAGGGFAP